MGDRLDRSLERPERNASLESYPVLNHLKVNLLGADRREDDEIRGAALQNLIWDAEVPSDSIDVKVQGGWVTLRGDVSFQFQSDAAYDDVSRLYRSPRPRYRPQRVSVPPQSRGRFFAAGTAVAITFAVFGLITSLAPSFLAKTLNEPSHALAGAVSFALFGTAALAQTLTGSRSPHQLLAAAIPALLVGIGLLTLAVWVPSPSFGIFLAGDLVAGVGAGLMFKGAIETVTEISLPERRAEAIAGFFLAAYIGLAGPVIGLGALTQIASTRVSLLVFSGLLALGIFAATPTLLGGRGHPASAHPVSLTH